VVILRDRFGRSVRLTRERLGHLTNTHPELKDQVTKISETLLFPDRVIESRTDSSVSLYYRHYDHTPVTEKYMCVVVKSLTDDHFVITAYFTDSEKQGKVLWEKR